MWLEWSPQRLEFFVDDRKYFTLENDGTGVDLWPFDAPQYLILNLAIGGAWGGQRGVDDAIFPQRLADGLPALESHAENSEQVTDHYLATLAHRHGCKLATLDGSIRHPAVERIEPTEAGSRGASSA